MLSTSEKTLYYRDSKLLLKGLFDVNENFTSARTSSLTFSSLSAALKIAETLEIIN